MARNSDQYRVRHTIIDVTGGKQNPANFTYAYQEGDLLTLEHFPAGQAGKDMLRRFLDVGAISLATPDELKAEAVSPATGTEGVEGGEERE
jgi:hypothetical protein